MKYFVALILLTLSMNALAAKKLTSIEGADVVSGKNIQLETKTAAKATVLVFLSSKCPCSASHEALLKDLATQFKDFNFVAIHSNSDEPADMTKDHFANSKLPFPVIQDSKSHLANELGALKTPHVFVLAKDGSVFYQGGVTDSHNGAAATTHFLKEVLEDLNAGKESRHKEGRALGCFIQREDS